MDKHNKKFHNLKKEEGKRIILEYIDIGNISHWGRPLSNEKKIISLIIQNKFLLNIKMIMI